MEFIEGKAIEPLEDISAIEKVACLFDYFATFRHNIPGSLCGGFCRGLLFPETEDLVFDSMNGMEEWFNSRLFAHNPNLTLQGCEFVFCHFDIAPRNILWQEDGSLCLVDWASSGYYPRLFEFCSQWIIEGKYGSFSSLLLSSKKPLSDQGMAQKEVILCAWRNIQNIHCKCTGLQLVVDRNSYSSSQFEEVKRSLRHLINFTSVPPPMPDYPPGLYEQFEREGFAPTR